MICKKLLPGGTVLLMERMSEVETISVGLWLRCGSAYESEKFSGVSHFIEHMVFKGTGNRSAKQIAEELDHIGGQVNAFSAKEYTCFYARVTCRHLHKALDILFDIVFNPSFKEEDFVKEKNVILEEIKMYEDTPDEIIHDLLPFYLFENTTLKLPILGSPESLGRIGVGDLKEFYEKFYNPGNLIVSFGGKVDFDEVEKIVNDKINYYYDRMQPEKSEIPDSSMSFNKGEVYREKGIEQNHMLIGFPGIAHLDDRLYPFNMLNNILAGSMSSRIFQKIREEMGQAYSTYSYLLTYRSGGLFAIYVACDPKNISNVQNAVWGELEKLKKEGISDRELEIARNQYISSLYLSLESTYNRMLRLAKYEFYYNRYVSASEIEQKILGISCDKVKSVAGEFLKRESSLTVTLGRA